MNILVNSPFIYFLLPGLLLLFFVEVYPSMVAFSLWQRPGWRWANLLNPFKRMYWSWAASLAAGVAAQAGVALGITAPISGSPQHVISVPICARSIRRSAV